jgi:hypothetical protein
MNWTVPPVSRPKLSITLETQLALHFVSRGIERIQVTGRGTHARIQNGSAHNVRQSKSECLECGRAANALHEIGYGFVRRSPDSAWSGLISHLTELCGGNVHAENFVAVSCSSTECNQCWNVVNYDRYHFCYTNNSANSWIQFDFKDRLISLIMHWNRMEMAVIIFSNGHCTVQWIGIHG